MWHRVGACVIDFKFSTVKNKIFLSYCFKGCCSSLVLYFHNTVTLTRNRLAKKKKVLLNLIQQRWRCPDFSAVFTWNAMDGRDVMLPNCKRLNTLNIGLWLMWSIHICSVILSSTNSDTSVMTWIFMWTIYKSETHDYSKLWYDIAPVPSSGQAHWHK